MVKTKCFLIERFIVFNLFLKGKEANEFREA